MPQFTIVSNYGTTTVTAKDKYEAIDNFKKQYPDRAIKDIKDTRGQSVK